MKKGFTLIELLAVVLIIGILTAVAMPQYRRSVERTRVAEALQMLPAIFDARERVVTENGWSWQRNPGFSSSAEKNVKFSLLDMELKGTAQDKLTWKTDNFTYRLSANAVGGHSAVAAEPAFVTATMGRGIYKGTVIYYNGSRLLCCRPSMHSDACTLLNLTEDSQCLAGLSD